MTRPIAGFLVLCASTAVVVGQPLHDAARTGDLAGVQAVVGQGADVDSRDQTGETPLLIAALEGRQAVVQWLVAHDADIHARNRDGLTALHAAAYGGHEAIVAVLLDRGANIDDADNSFGIVPLHPSAEENHIGIVQLLIARGANLNVREANGFTPLSRATFKANWDVVRVLKHHGAECQSVSVVGIHFRQQCIEAR